MNNKEDKKKIIIVIITAIAAFVALILLVVGIIVAREIISDVKSQNEYKVQQQKWNFRDDMINRIPGDKDLS